MAEDPLETLTRFHREVMVPDMERIVDERVGGLREDMLSHFDAIYARFDRLEHELTSPFRDRGPARTGSYSS